MKVNQSQEEFIVKGTVERVLPRGEFKVKLVDFENSLVHCKPSGKMRKYYIKMVSGDKVMIKMTKYDLTKGTIIVRGWNEEPPRRR